VAVTRPPHGGRVVTIEEFVTIPSAAIAREREGTTLPGGTVVDRLLASGGMASVYLGRGPHEEPVAIKIMHAHLLEAPTVKERFVREGRLCQSLVHEGVPVIHSVSELADGTVALVMDLLSGETVAQRMRRKGGYLPPQEVLAIADRVLDVLEAAHARGIVHRDIKPDNVFLTADGGLKLLDFGVAGAREQDGEKLTQAGFALGTPAFMSPEQAQGAWEEVDGRTDLWAVGATMFTLLVGEPPHVAATPLQELVAAATESIPPIATRIPGLRPALAEVVDRALLRERDARFADAATMHEAVRRAWASVGGSAPMQLVWDQIANEVEVSSPEIEVRASDALTIDAPAASVHSDVVPAGTADRGDWSIPPPSDVARIVTVEELAKSDSFAALAPLLQRSSRPSPPQASNENAVTASAAASSTEGESRSRAVRQRPIVWLVVVLIVVALGALIARVTR
jgi:serine/threonine-protein kinase